MCAESLSLLDLTESVCNSSAISTLISEVVVLAFIHFMNENLYHFMGFIASYIESEHCGAVRSTAWVVGSVRKAEGLQLRRRGDFPPVSDGNRSFQCLIPYMSHSVK